MNSTLSKIALGFVIFGTLWIIGRSVLAPKSLRDQSTATPFLLECDKCQARFNYDKVEWSAREYSPSEWKDEYRNRNDCLECGEKWAAKIIGEGSPKDFRKTEPEPEPPKVAGKKPRKQAQPRVMTLPTIGGKTDEFVIEPIPAPPVNPNKRTP